MQDYDIYIFRYNLLEWIIEWLCLVLDKAAKEAAKEERERKEKKFLDLCKEGNIESVKTLLAEDPSLINSKDDDGKS